MKSPEDQVDILYQQVQGTAFKNALSGDIYPDQRPDNSLLEDAVIKSLPLVGNEFQYGTAVINIYVPDQKLLLKGKAQYVANTARFKVLTDLILPVLKDRYTDQYRYEVTNVSNATPVSDVNYHYVNLRIDFLFFPS